MPVFRVEKTKNYTVMANHHLKNKELSLKAKGLLSVLLSLPDTWEHSIAGYAAICKEGVDGISSTIKELEQNGYVIRNRLRNEKGHFMDTEYIILEIPKEQLNEENQNLENPIMENPILDNPKEEKPIVENPIQLSTKKLSIKELNTNELNLNQIHQKAKKCFGYEMMGFESLSELKEVVYHNTEYEHFMENSKYGEKEQIAEMVDIIVETLCSTRSSINIGGDDYPAELVKNKMLKINSSHIQYVLSCLKETRVDIRNIKRYLLASLFNAPSTIDNYYRTKVNYDLGS